MKTVAWCYDAGLSLAALARLGGAVEKVPQDEAADNRASEGLIYVPCPGLYPWTRNVRKRRLAAHPFLKGLLDLSAEAGERSDRKPGVVTPRGGLHKVKPLERAERQLT